MNDKDSNSGWWFGDYLVDFLGILVPGLLFITIMMIILIFDGWIAFKAAERFKYNLSKVVNSTQDSLIHRRLENKSELHSLLREELNKLDSSVSTSLRNDTQQSKLDRINTATTTITKISSIRASLDSLDPDIYNRVLLQHYNEDDFIRQEIISGLVTIKSGIKKVLDNEAFIICLSILFLVSSYVCGHLFYRGETKRLDRISFRKYYMRISRKERQKWVYHSGNYLKKELESSLSMTLDQKELDILIEKINLACDDTEKEKMLREVLKARDPKGNDLNLDAKKILKDIADLEALESFYDQIKGQKHNKKGVLHTESLFIEKLNYPYSAISQYFEERKINHLTNICPGLEYPSETFINIIKIRIGLHCIDKIRELNRNEAHLRLMSSIWYAFKALTNYLFLISLIFVLLYVGILFGVYSFSIKQSLLQIVSNFDSFLKLLFKQSTFFLIVLVIHCILGFFFYKIYLIIESFFHTQRVRELVYILETAYQLDKDHNQILNEFRGNIKTS
ncbi:hypothetical protein [Xanthocytophaga flava]|uniref:hypothetical protein n=1 Tax=Xanthocytophaga flava TaxID=3048013 RepID=UPI0028D69439|nr:hypothetical protein [Xanthocytophaga flavus]MDJ1473798.1 hypothetical protein [Xanthocytophaga flavus]